MSVTAPFSSMYLMLIAIGLLQTQNLYTESPNKQIIHGLLVEGADYTGKSTICTLLTRRLQTENINVQHNHCFLNSDSIVHFLYEQGSTTQDLHQALHFFAAGILVDVDLFVPKKDIFYIQDRNWLTFHCITELFKEKIPIIPNNFILDKHIPFKWNVLLVSDPETKKKRFEKRTKRTAFNQYFFENPNELQKYEQLLKQKIPENENWLIIDTSKTTAEEVADRIYKFLKT